MTKAEARRIAKLMEAHGYHQAQVIKHWDGGWVVTTAEGVKIESLDAAEARFGALS